MIGKLRVYFDNQGAQFLFLALMLAVLPILEAPKNLFALLFVLSWVVIAKTSRDWGGRWRSIDTIFLLWILADIAVGMNAVIVHDQPANGSKDIIKFVLVGWAISRAGFTTKQMIHLSLIAIFFTVIPLAYSYLDLGRPRLHSVGHVNHVAIYLLLVYIISLSLLVFNFKNIGNLVRILLISTSIVLAIAVVDTNSRAATGLLVLVTLMAIAYVIYLYKSWRIGAISVLFMSIVSTTLVYNPSQVVNKFANGTSLISDDSPRQKIRNFAYYVVKIDPVLGTGMGNFPNFNHDDIKDLVIEDMGLYDDSQFMPFKHPHNIYYTYLTGGGILLFSVFVWFWLQIANIIYRVNIKSNEKWIVFSGVGVVMAVLSIGWVNTTLAHEHALIAMFVLGMLISLDRKTHAK